MKIFVLYIRCDRCDLVLFIGWLCRLAATPLGPSILKPCFNLQAVRYRTFMVAAVHDWVSYQYQPVCRSASILWPISCGLPVKDTCDWRIVVLSSVFAADWIEPVRPFAWNCDRMESSRCTGSNKTAIDSATLWITIKTHLSKTLRIWLTDSSDSIYFSSFNRRKFLIFFRTIPVSLSKRLPLSSQQFPSIHSIVRAHRRTYAKPLESSATKQNNLKLNTHK